MKLPRFIAKPAIKMTNFVKINSPELLMIAGVVGIGATVVLACKATLKAEAELEEVKTEIEDIREEQEETHESHGKELAVAYAKGAIKLTKLYSPAFVAGLVTVGCFGKSHNILSARNASLAAAYKVLETGFTEYRQRVKDTLGEETDKQFRYGIRSEKITSTVVDENGKKTKVHERVDVVENKPSIYAKFFDESCPRWQKQAEYNLAELQAAQEYFNKYLVTNGILFLNDVYKHLGMPLTQAGQAVGWYYDPSDPTRQNHVHFDIFNVRNADAINGYNNVFIVDFNVDTGYILDKLGYEQILNKLNLKKR